MSKKFRTQVITPQIKLTGTSETPDTTAVTVLQKDNSGNVMISTGTTVPTDTESGFAKGSLFIDTNVAGGTSGLYENVGTTSSCNFDLIGAGGVPGTTLAGLTDTDLSSPTSAQVLIYDGSNSWDNKSISGDISIAADGTVSLTAGAIVNADVNAAAAIAFTKLAALTRGSVLIGNSSNAAAAVDGKGDGYILVGDGTDLASVAVSGDVTLTNTGATTVTDLTISSEAQGDVLYFNGSNWVRLAAGTSGQSLVTAGAGSNPYWGSPSVASASGLANNVTCEAGASDYTIDFGAAGGAYTLTVPAVGGARTFAFINEAQNFSANQTFDQTTLLLKGGDTNTVNIKINETETSARTLNIKVNDADRTVDLTGNLTLAGNLTTTTDAITLAATGGGSSVTVPASGTLATVAGTETLTNKTVTNLVIDDGDAGLTITSADQTNAAATITVPDIGDAADNVVLEDTAQTLTNKTLTSAVLNTGVSGTAVLDEDNMATDSATQLATQQSIKAYVDSGTVTFTNKSINCDGTGNVITNVNMNEMDSVAAPSAGDASDSVYAAAGILIVNISNQAAAVNVYNANAPFKFRIIRAWSINKSADGGTWKLNDGAGGAGTDITNAVSVAANDQDIDEPTDYDDSVQNIASSGSLSVVPDGGGALDCDIYIQIVRLD